MRSFPLLSAALSLLLATLAVAAPACSSSQRIAGAKQYVKATVSHSPSDAAAIPLASDCIRYESFNGAGPFETGFNGDSIKASTVIGPQAFTVTGLKSATYTDAGNGTIIGAYTLKAGLVGQSLTTADVYELFTYPQTGDTCNMVRIDAYVTIPGS